MFGLTSADLPADWEAFVAYNEAMVQSDTLSVSAAAREVAGQIFAGEQPWLRPPRWYQALSAQMLPGRLRMDFGFVFDEHDRKAAERALAWIRRVYPKLPSAFATSGPIRKLKRDYKENRSSTGLPDGLIGFGSDGPNWMIAGTGEALLDAICKAHLAV